MDRIVSGPPGHWRAFGRNIASDQRDENWNWSAQQEKQWFPLKAKTETQAEREMKAFNRQIDAEWDKNRKAAGDVYSRDDHYHAWGQAHKKLRKMVDALAKLRATTTAGLRAGLGMRC